MNYNRILQLIEEYDTITIFRHQRPDCDASGSQFGLKQWINDNYPEKKVYALGTEASFQGRFPALDTADDEVIRNSLAVIVDTNTPDRVDDQRYSMAAHVLKIDHHPDLYPYADDNEVNDKAAAVCEILAEFMKSAKDKTVSKETAEYLYQGLLTDTLCFMTGNTTPSSLMAAAYLAQTGINIPEINRYLFDVSLKEYAFANFIRSGVKTIDNKLAYFILSLEDQEKWGINGSEARNFIGELGHVKEFEIWAMFTAKDNDGMVVYDGSLRSKTAPVNTVAQFYGGGGHSCAAGVKNLTEEKLKQILPDLLSLLNN